MWFTRLAAAVALAGLLAAPRAWAGGAKSVTLLGVSGAGGERFARGIESDLSELYDVVSGDVYRSAAEQLGKKGASPEDVSAVSTRLRIDAVVGGAVVGEGRERRLLLAVREGSSGRVVARARYDLSGRTLPLVREKVVSDLVRAFEHIRPVGRSGQPARTNEPVADAELDSPPEGEAEIVPATSGERVSVEKSGRRPATQAAGVSAGIGPSLLARYLSFDVPSAPGYSGGTVAGLRVEGAVFPIALSSELAQAHPVLASFGFLASFENIFDFHSATATGSSVGRASRWDSRLAGRIPLGHAARGGTLTVETGWVQLNWSHNAPVEVGVPNVSWGAIDAGLGWDKDLGARWLQFGLRFAYLGVVQSGDISDDTQYGRSTGSGIALDAMLTASPAKWLWIRLRASYDRLALSFAGAGIRFAHSATDQWVGGQLEVGFAL